MSDNDKPSPPLPGSSSAPASPSQDALNTASVRELGRTLDSFRTENDRLREENRVMRKQGEGREAQMTRALDLNTGVIAEHNERSNGFIRLVREVLSAWRTDRTKLDEALAKLSRQVEETGKHLTHKPEPEDEISAQHIKLRWSTIWGALKAVPLVVKAFGVIAALAGATWALLSRLAHRL